jgi:hypothetical protein
MTSLTQEVATQLARSASNECGVHDELTEDLKGIFAKGLNIVLGGGNGEPDKQLKAVSGWTESGDDVFDSAGRIASDVWASTGGVLNAVRDFISSSNDNTGETKPSPQGMTTAMTGLPGQLGQFGTSIATAAWNSGTGLPRLGPANWNPTSVEAVLRVLLERLSTVQVPGQRRPIGPGPRLARAASELFTELPALAGRASAARVFSLFFQNELAKNHGRPLPSSFDVGRRVHGKLQERYRLETLPFHLVEQDGRVWGGGLPPEGRPLSRAVTLKRFRIGDASLHALYMARTLLMRSDDRVGESGTEFILRGLRDDTCDLTIGELWEIKPVTRAWEGTCVEFVYRHSYNLYAAWLDDLQHPGPGPAVTRKLMAGGGWPNSPRSLTPFPAWAIPSTGLVFPVSPRKEISGLLLYFLVRISPKDVQRLVRSLKTLLDRAWKRLESILKELRESIDRLIPPPPIPVPGYSWARFREDLPGGLTGFILGLLGGFALIVALFASLGGWSLAVGGLGAGAITTLSEIVDVGDEGFIKLGPPALERTRTLLAQGLSAAADAAEAAANRGLLA